MIDTDTQAALDATPPGSKRDKLQRIAELGWRIRRPGQGRIELHEPDTGGWWQIWKVKTETDLDKPGLLVALHWRRHGTDGLQELRERVYGH